MFLIFLIAVLFSLALRHFFINLAHLFFSDKLTKHSAKILLSNFFLPANIYNLLLPSLFFLAQSQANFSLAKISPPGRINCLNFKNPRQGLSLIGLTGLLTNFLLVLSTLFIFKIIPKSSLLLTTFLVRLIEVNLAIVIFNLIPLPPLDAAKIIAPLFSYNFSYKFLQKENYFLLFLLFSTGIISKIILPLDYCILKILGIYKFL